MKNQRNIIFLNTINSVYDNFKFFKSNGDISVYTYADNEVENIPDSSGKGDIVFIIPKNGGFIIVDYALVTPDLFNKMIKNHDRELWAKAEKEKYKTNEEKKGRIAALKCSSILAYRECRNDFDKERTEFGLDIAKYFLSE